MTINPFNHIDLRVSNLDEATRFYGALLKSAHFVTIPFSSPVPPVNFASQRTR